MIKSMTPTSNDLSATVPSKSSVQDQLGSGSGIRGEPGYGLESQPRLNFVF